jgi:hypothetical protein
LTTPREILAAGWDFLVNPVMREGGYVRYDGRKSTQILHGISLDGYRRKSMTFARIEAGLLRSRHQYRRQLRLGSDRE